MSRDPERSDSLPKTGKVSSDAPTSKPEQTPTDEPKEQTPLSQSVDDEHPSNGSDAQDDQPKTPSWLAFANRVVQSVNLGGSSTAPQQNAAEANLAEPESPAPKIAEQDVVEHQVVEPEVAPSEVAESTDPAQEKTEESGESNAEESVGGDSFFFVRGPKPADVAGESHGTGDAKEPNESEEAKQSGLPMIHSDAQPNRSIQELIDSLEHRPTQRQSDHASDAFVFDDAEPNSSEETSDEPAGDNASDDEARKAEVAIDSIAEEIVEVAAGAKEASQIENEEDVSQSDDRPTSPASQATHPSADFVEIAADPIPMPSPETIENRNASDVPHEDEHGRGQAHGHEQAREHKPSQDETIEVVDATEMMADADILATADESAPDVTGQQVDPASSSSNDQQSVDNQRQDVDTEPEPLQAAEEHGTAERAPKKNSPISPPPPFRPVPPQPEPKRRKEFMPRTPVGFIPTEGTWTCSCGAEVFGTWSYCHACDKPRPQ